MNAQQPVHVYPEPKQAIVRSVRIIDLPDCYQRERLLTIAARPEVTVIVVGKPGMIDDWACYIGWPQPHELADQTNQDHLYYARRQHTIAGVMEHGDKLSEDTARALFPEFTARWYRS